MKRRGWDRIGWLRFVRAFGVCMSIAFFFPLLAVPFFLLYADDMRLILLFPAGFLIGLAFVCFAGARLKAIASERVRYLKSNT